MKVDAKVLSQIAKGIEKSLGEGKLRKIKDTEFQSTGIKAIDWALGGGCPIGQMTEVFGEFSTGKTLLGEHLIAETQKAGGIGIFIDSERRFSAAMANAVDIDTEALLYLCPSCLEQVYTYIETIAKEVRSQFDGLIALVWDSLGGTQAKDEMEGEVTLRKMRGLRAHVNSVGLAKIIPLVDDLGVAFYVTNQLRDRPDVMYGKTWYTMGGNAPEFYSTVQVWLKKGKKIQVDTEGNRVEGSKKKGKVIGLAGSLEVVKNSVSPPFREVEFEIFYDRGIPHLSGWLDCLVEQGEVKQGGGWYEYKGEKFRSKDFEKMWEEKDG